MSSSTSSEKSQAETAAFLDISRPSPALLTYYILTSFCSLFAIIIVLPTLWLRYSTLRYQLEDTGVRMQVGWLFRKEVIVAFRRIQDIHVSSNLIQRWLGISSVSIQTASGSALPEIIIEGVVEPDALRDWLYERTRGAKGERNSLSQNSDLSADSHSSSNPLPSLNSSQEIGIESTGASDDVIAKLLIEIRDNLAALTDHREVRDE